MYALLLTILFNVFICSQLNSFFSNHFIGLEKKAVEQIMRTEYKQLKLNTSNVNHEFNYLKYEDYVNEITVLFFLTDENVCKRIRLISDYSNLNDVISGLDSHYNQVGKNKWQYSASSKNYAVILDEGDWFFTVTIKNIDELK